MKRILTMKRLLRAALLALAFFGPAALGQAWAGPAEELEEGYLAIEKGDYETAMRKWRPLAEQGVAPAQYNLAQMYANGRSVPQDFVKAYAWYSLAADGFSPGEDREGAIKNRDSLTTEMTPSEIAEAKRIADNWKSGSEKF